MYPAPSPAATMRNKTDLRTFNMLSLGCLTDTSVAQCQQVERPLHVLSGNLNCRQLDAISLSVRKHCSTSAQVRNTLLNKNAKAHR